MKYGKITVLLFTAVLTVVAVAVWYHAPEGEDLPLTASLGSEELVCWTGDSQNHYFFLPSHASLAQLQLHTGGFGDLALDGVELVEGMSCGDFSLGIPYRLTWSGVVVGNLTFLQSANVPSLFLDVASGSMDYLHQDKAHRESGTLRLFTSQGALAYSGRLDSVSGRGNSTWGMSKKPYSLTLSQAADLLGMGAAQNWVLLADSMDASHLRNYLAFSYAEAVGLAYTPQCQWVDLYLNGEYAGLYLLSERNEIHPERVDLSAGQRFLVSKDYEWRLEAQGRSYVMTQGNVALRIYDGSMPPDAILTIFQQLEDAILSPDGTDPATGQSWQDLLDLDSWAGKYLVEELLGNVDGGVLSQYFYYDGEGKVFAGPVWDFDLAMANTSAYPYPAPNMFYVNREGVYGSPWFAALYRDETFYRRVVTLYETLYRPVLAEYVDARIDDYARQIAQAAILDGIRWPEQADPGQETQSIKAYLQARMEVLDRLWLQEEPYVTFYADYGDGALYCYALRPGDLPPQLPETDCGWQVRGTGEAFDLSQPVYEDVQIAVRPAPEAAAADEEEAHSPGVSRLTKLSVVIFLMLFAAVALTDFLRGRRRSHG